MDELLAQKIYCLVWLC